jgi:hypothetical protein
MTPRSLHKWIVLVVALALIVPTASVAFAVVDEFGGATFGTQYAPFTEPYEWGPVIHESDLAPYAPYTEPYEWGPVIHPSDLAPYAPFTEPYVPMDSTHWMIR